MADMSRRSARGEKADRILEDALEHELRGASTPPGESCIDAEMLAAWEDNGLDADTTAFVEAHVSACARCQAMVATSLQAREALTTAIATATESTAAPTTLAFWKWLAPLAAGAAAVTLWMVVPDQQEIATAPPQPAAATEAAKVEPPLASALPSAAPSEAPATPQPQAKPRADATAAKEQRSAERIQERVELPAMRDAPADAAMPAPPTSPPVAFPAAAAPAIAGLQRSSQFAFGPLEIVSPEPAQRWRITPDGVEHSVNAGGTWSLVRPAVGETITGGVSPSEAVCWLIGNNGVVLLTTNGTVFTRRDIPNAGNLRSITAADASTATVVNAAGRTFRTDDGGRTWY